MMALHRLPWALALVAAPVALVAQTPPPGSPPGAPPPRDPLLLPGDQPPPPMSVIVGQPRPPGAPMPPPAPPPVHAPPLGPTQAVALAAAQAALAQCAKDGLKVGTAVADSQGNLFLGLIMDGANPGRIYSASRKNLVAIAFKEPSSAVQARLRAGDAATRDALKPNMTPFAGAVPLIVGGQMVGAIGVSGGTAPQDEVCAAAGAAKVRS